MDSWYKSDSFLGFVSRWISFRILVVSYKRGTRIKINKKTNFSVNLCLFLPVVSNSQGTQYFSQLTTHRISHSLLLNKSLLKEMKKECLVLP